MVFKTQRSVEEFPPGPWVFTEVLCVCWGGGEGVSTLYDLNLKSSFSQISGMAHTRLFTVPSAVSVLLHLCAQLLERKVVSLTVCSPGQPDEESCESG